MDVSPILQGFSWAFWSPGEGKLSAW